MVRLLRLNCLLAWVTVNNESLLIGVSDRTAICARTRLLAAISESVSSKKWAYRSSIVFVFTYLSYLLCGPVGNCGNSTNPAMPLHFRRLILTLIPAPPINGHAVQSAQVTFALYV